METPTLDFMIDIETLGRRNDAFIIEMACVTRTDSVQYYFDPEEQEAYSRRVEAATMHWHINTHPEMIKHMLEMQGMQGQSVASIRSDLDEFIAWQIRKFRDVLQCESYQLAFWMNSPRFDGAILQHCFQQIEDTDLPWTFRDEADYRTLRRLAKAKDRNAFDNLPQPPDNAHQALVDASYQLDMISHFKHIINC